tara:strand:- start:1035 stop:2825 length:1791 start_codon:yes stop_codon:yes gene_type:complete
MADLRPIGSEKLPLDQKLQRIMEIANYGTQPKVETHKTASLEYNVTAADGNKYGIIRENSKYMILKEGSNGYTYLDGMKNNSRYSFNSYSEALKKLNLLMKPINESYNNGKQFNLIGEQEEAGKKFVLKQPEAEVEDEEETFDFGDDAGTDEGGETEDFSFDDVEMGMDDDSGEEIEGSMEVEVTDDEDATKAVQKLTGKLGQKLRDLPETDMDADIIKYVLNSVISAVNLEKLSEEDKEEIVEKFEDEDIEYTEEGEFDVDLGGEEELDLDGEDFDLGGEEGMDLETELSEGWGALGRAAATGFGAMLADKATRRMGMDEEEEEGTLSAEEELALSEMSTQRHMDEMFVGEHGPLNMILKKVMDDDKLAQKFIDAVLDCANLQQIQDLVELIDWVKGRPDHCGKVMNIVQDENCVLDLTKYLTSDNFKGMSCLLSKAEDNITTPLFDKVGDMMGMFELDEEDMIQVPENPELSDEAAEAVADVFDMFESDSKVGKTLTSYFNYTKEEKRKIQESRERKRFNLHLAKNELLESVLNKARVNKTIKNSYSSYEQERTTNQFLKENKNVRFVGKNSKGSLIFKGKNNLVEINTRGRIS